MHSHPGSRLEELEVAVDDKQNKNNSQDEKRVLYVE